MELKSDENWFWHLFKHVSKYSHIIKDNEISTVYTRPISETTWCRILIYITYEALEFHHNITVICSLSWTKDWIWKQASIIQKETDIKLELTFRPWCVAGYSPYCYLPFCFFVSSSQKEVTVPVGMWWVCQSWSSHALSPAPAQSSPPSAPLHPPLPSTHLQGWSEGRLITPFAISLQRAISAFKNRNKAGVSFQKMLFWTSSQQRAFSLSYSLEPF